MNQECEEAFRVYREDFLPVYANYVALTRSKPEQIVLEESNILSHIVASHDMDRTEEERSGNAEKAVNHLNRITLDTHKLLWIELARRLDILMSNGGVVAFNIPVNEATKLHKEFIDGIRQARMNEMRNIGGNIRNSIAAYEEANNKGWALLESFDLHKRQKTWRRFLRDQFIGFILGVIASVIASVLWCIFTK